MGWHLDLADCEWIQKEAGTHKERKSPHAEGSEVLKY